MSGRKPKNPIHYQIELNIEQKEAKEIIMNHKTTLLKGGPGSGKSLLACNVALDMLFNREVERIYIARPFVYAEKEPLGILPGGVQEKMIGLTTPIFDNMYNLCSKEKIDSLLQENKIVILPLGFVRGMTISRSVWILDEFQNAKLSQVYDSLTRLGKGTKIIITGDMSQCDLPNKNESGFDFFDFMKKSGRANFEIIDLSSNHRDEDVEIFASLYKEYKDGKK